MVVMISTTKAASYPCNVTGLVGALTSLGGSHSLSCTSSSPTITLTGQVWIANTAAITLDCNWATVKCTLF